MERSEEDALRTQIHYRINEISPTFIAGNCGGHNYEIRQEEGKVSWCFLDTPEEKQEAQTLHEALFDIIMSIHASPGNPGECYCAVCEEFKASPLRLFHAGILFDTGMCLDYVFVNTGASEKSFVLAARRSAKRAAAKSKKTSEACTRFLRYMGKQGFVCTSNFKVGSVDLLLSVGPTKNIIAEVKRVED